MADKVAKSFDLVDDKLAEADFFLEKLRNSSTDLFAARCYFSAFVSAARSVTFALQGVMKSQVNGFDEWYERKQDQLRQDPLARFFHDARTEVQHFGLNAVNAGRLETVEGKARVKLYFGSTTPGIPLKNAPSCDVVTACTRYLTSIVSLIHDCYEDFGSAIDPRSISQRKTSKNSVAPSRTLKKMLLACEVGQMYQGCRLRQDGRCFVPPYLIPRLAGCSRNT